jgi:hypothetical protein
MIYVRTLIVLLSLLSLANAYAADWRYTGNTGGKDNEAMFYDADSVEHPNKDIVRVWTKTIPQKALNDYYKKHGSEKWYIENVGRKIATGYSPEFFELPQVKKHFSIPKPDGETLDDFKIDITGEEFLANTGEVKATSKVYDEILCSEMRIGFLSITVYRKDGSVANTDHESPEHKHIPPDSTGQWLSMLVCPKS